jgi:hypothetical protein
LPNRLSTLLRIETFGEATILICGHARQLLGEADQQISKGKWSLAALAKLGATSRLSASLGRAL